MLKKFLLGTIAVLASILLIGLALPGDWRIENSITIDAPPARIYRDVATLSTWREWSAWNRERDPTCKNFYAGPTTGVGSRWRWEGDPNGLHRGTMVVTKGDPQTGIDYDIDLEGFPTFKGNIAFQPTATGTKVVWTSSGTTGGGLMMELMMKYAILFGALESAMDEEYRSSLAKLKFRAESASAGTPVDASTRKK